MVYVTKKKSLYYTHIMNKKVDEGLVVSQRRFPILKDDTVHSLYAKVYGMAAETLDEGITNLLTGTSYPDITDITPSYYSFPTKDTFDALFSSGRHFC